jgi:hypothetical protein
MHPFLPVLRIAEYDSYDFTVLLCVETIVFAAVIDL